MIETVEVRPVVVVSRPAAPWRGIHQDLPRLRVLGGLAFCLLSLNAFVLVARHLSDASWPLAEAHIPLVFLAGCSYLASFGFRAFGWHQLFPSASARPRTLSRGLRGGRSQRSGPALPARLCREDLHAAPARRGDAGARDNCRLDPRPRHCRCSGDASAGRLRPLATSGPVLRAPLIVVVLFCTGCFGILMLGQRVARLPLIGRSHRLHIIYRRLADSTRFSRPTLVAGLLLLGCWTSRALGSTFLLSALGVPFSPTLALSSSA